MTNEMLKNLSGCHRSDLLSEGSYIA